ncbi:hypothetical protein ABPG74_008488 [Tetrahymena malaccensis]
MNTSISVQFEKYRRGGIGKKVTELYLRDDISCGLKNCQHCKTPGNTLDIEGEDRRIFILDEYTVLTQLDVILNCPKLVNVVLMQTTVHNVQKKNQNTYTSLRNLVEGEIYRNIHIYANEYSKYTYTPIQQNEKQETRDARAVLEAAIWYQKHLQSSMRDIEVLFITSDYQSHKMALEKGLNSTTIFEFVKSIKGEYPNLMDFLGISEQAMDIEFEGQQVLFQEHLTLNELSNKVKAGELFQGKLKIDRNDINDGTVFIPKYDFEIKIIGQSNLNRALHGDLIAIELLPESEWISSNYMGDNEDEEEDFKNVHEAVKTNSSNKQLEERYLNVVEKIKKLNLNPTGKVVGVIKRIQRYFCGEVTPEKINLPNLPNGIELREFLPADGRFPHFYLRTTNGSHLEGKKIQIGFDNWSKSSKYPLGHFKMLIGDSGDTKAEGDVILLEHNVEYRAFSKQVLDCLPPQDDKWQIPESEVKKRVDLRGINVCSIDPPGCKDIDDALHCITLPNGNFEVGVHIADVSYFVRPDTAIDKEAQNRCTTVYLVDRRTDMLPKLLTETLCSLKDDGDRLAFSVVWVMDKDANIIETRYHKSIIRSVASLNYGKAQSMIDDVNDNSELTKSIRNLNMLAKKLKQKRIDNGALSLASTQVKFTFDDETHNPVDVQFYQMYETNSLIEEFMLLGNVAVAEKIVSHFPSISILRQHSQPKPKQIKELSQILQKIGFNLDYSSNRNLADSLDKVNRPNDHFFNKLVRIMTTRSMNEATYFCTADADYPEFYHYGLAAPLYTHFTSPIRRYADVLVHRLLAAAIDIEAIPAYMSNKLKMAKICEKMNMRNRMARFASRSSSDYNTYLFFKDKQIEEVAMVSSISKTGATVVVPRYGLEGQIKFNEKDLKENEKLLQELKQSQSLIIDFVVNGNRHKLFDYLKVRVSVGMKNFHKQITLEYLGPK